MQDARTYLVDRAKAKLVRIVLDDGLEEGRRQLNALELSTVEVTQRLQKNLVRDGLMAGVLKRRAFN